MKTEPNHPISPVEVGYTEDGKNWEPLQTDYRRVMLNGLTKREHFAAMALQALIQTPTTDRFDKKTITELAVEYSDKLIDTLNNE